MGLSKLGDYIELVEFRNSSLSLGENDVRGISIKKEFIPTKADMDGVSLSPYKLVMPNGFSYVTVTSRNGGKISLAQNTSNKKFLVSSSYVVFKVKNTSELLPNYLFMYFNRPEFDRYARYNSWGSARETFSWEDMCDIEIEIPSIEIQQKYVDIYNAMKANQEAYEKGLDDLKLTCDAYIEKLRRTTQSEKIGTYIEARIEKNKNSEIKLSQGISNEKYFMNPKQVAVDNNSAQIVRNGQFAYNRATTRNGEKISIAYRNEKDCTVSGAYQVFEIVKEDLLLAEYLLIWFKRTEFDRYARYHSKGSAHEFFEFDEMCEVKIPIPDIEVQESIVNIYSAYMERKNINEKLKQQIKDICPILVKGSLEEGKR